ncbi:MAG: rhodanese-like domain-containing protein [Anaerolineales bacterium]
MKKPLRVILMVTPLLIGALLLGACSGPVTGDGANAGLGEMVSVGSGSYTNLSPGELKAMLDEKDVTFINVHIPFQGDIPGTDLSVPFDEIEDNLDRLPEDKEARIVLYCRSGSMSRTASRTLVELGYTNVWNLEGGFNAWQEAGYPMAGEE